jgi:lysophospholipase L1-like esterase
MMRNYRALLLASALFLWMGCHPNIEKLVPDIEGTVLFDSIEAHVLYWSPEDVFVEVPPGIAGEVPVQVVMLGQASDPAAFLVLDGVELFKILCFGDSIIYGGVPEALQGLMDEDPYWSGLNPVALNQGRAAEVAARLKTQLRWSRALGFHAPDIAIFLEGTNDVSDDAAVPMEEIQQSVAGMLEEAVLGGVDLVACTLLPRVGSCRDAESPTTEEFNQWLRSYADGLGIPLVDVYEDFVSTPGWETVFFSEDCTHPNEQGRLRIAEFLKGELEERVLPSRTGPDRDGG